MPEGGATMLGWYSSSSSLLRIAASAAGDTPPELVDFLARWSLDTRLTASSMGGGPGVGEPACRRAISSMDMSKAVLAGLRSKRSEPGRSGETLRCCAVPVSGEDC